MVQNLIFNVKGDCNFCLQYLGKFTLDKYKIEIAKIRVYWSVYVPNV